LCGGGDDATCAGFRPELGFALSECDIGRDDAVQRAYFERHPRGRLDGGGVFDFNRRTRRAQELRERQSHDQDLREPRRVSGRVEIDAGPRQRPPLLAVVVAARLSVSLQVLTQARKMGKGTISSQELWIPRTSNSTQIRRELVGLGSSASAASVTRRGRCGAQRSARSAPAGQQNIAMIGRRALGKAIRLLGHSSPTTISRRCDLRTWRTTARVGTNVATRACDKPPSCPMVRDEDIGSVLAVRRVPAKGWPMKLVESGVKTS